MKFNTIALVLVVTGIAFLVAAGTGVPARLYDIVHHTHRVGTACKHAYEHITTPDGDPLVCRLARNGELTWQAR